MLVCYHRSSSLGTLEFCEMKYYFQYVLGMQDKTNKKAVLGTIVHRALQILGDKKITSDLEDHDNMVENDDIQHLHFDECDDIELITKICFDHYKAHEKELNFTKSDLNLCISWMHKALAHDGGNLDPRNQNVFATEEFFDIEIKEDWAKYDYVINKNGKEEVISGNLSIKGTVDLIVKEDAEYYQVLDYKTGKRLNWATGEVKTHEDLYKDTQLLLYYYALKTVHPEKSFYVSIYYINDGGIFDMVFDDSDFKKAENILRQKFEYIKSVELPRQLSSSQSHWKCQKLCKFSEDNGEGTSVCNHFHSLIKKDGIDKVTANYANLNKLTKYGSGGGTIREEK